MMFLHKAMFNMLNFISYTFLIVFFNKPMKQVNVSDFFHSTVFITKKWDFKNKTTLLDLRNGILRNGRGGILRAQIPFSTS